MAKSTFLGKCFGKKPGGGMAAGLGGQRKGWFLLVTTLSINFILTGYQANAQRAVAKHYLSLSQSIALAQTQNKWVQAARMEEVAAEAGSKGRFQKRITDYQRKCLLSTIFRPNPFHRRPWPCNRRPAQADTQRRGNGCRGFINLYNGGKQRALQREQTSRSHLAKLNAGEQSGNISLQTAGQYLDLVKLNELGKFIEDQLKRAQSRLANINALYKNQKVTRSDVLRAEVALVQCRALTPTERKRPLHCQRAIIGTDEMSLIPFRFYHRILLACRNRTFVHYYRYWKVLAPRPTPCSGRPSRLKCSSQG
jgi:hypothetical protein